AFTSVELDRSATGAPPTSTEATNVWRNVGPAAPAPTRQVQANSGFTPAPSVAFFVTDIEPSRTYDPSSVAVKGATCASVGPSGVGVSTRPKVCGADRPMPAALAALVSGTV